MDNNKITELLTFIKSKAVYLDYNVRINNIYNGNLSFYLKQRLKEDLSPSSYNEAVSRLNTVNILPKLINKLSQVGQSSIVNPAGGKAFEEKYYETGLSETMQLANLMLNMFNCVAIEPIVNFDFSITNRVLNGSQFLVYSDDDVNPNKMTHFIKIINMTQATAHYAVYTDTEYVEFDHNGVVLNQMENPHGKIPFVYFTRNTTELMPSSQIDTFEMVTLLPLMLTDANYALKFQAFSIIYALDADPSEMKLAPNVVWFLKSDEEGKKPEIGSIKPSLAIDDTIASINMQYRLWLDTKNIKSNAIGMGDKELSGIAKVIDDGDVSNDIDMQRKLIERAENDLIDLIYLKTGDSDYNGKVAYSKISRLPETTTEKNQRIIAQLDAGLITRVDAIRQIHNFETSEEAMAYIELIRREKRENI